MPRVVSGQCSPGKRLNQFRLPYYMTRMNTSMVGNRAFRDVCRYNIPGIWSSKKQNERIAYNQWVGRKPTRSRQSTARLSGPTLRGTTPPPRYVSLKSAGAFTVHKQGSYSCLHSQSRDVLQNHGRANVSLAMRYVGTVPIC